MFKNLKKKKLNEKEDYAPVDGPHIHAPTGSSN